MSGECHPHQLECTGVGAARTTGTFDSAHAAVMPTETSWRVPVLAGGAAGLVETILTYPLDLVKSLHQLKGGATNSVIGTLREVVAREGVGGLVRLGGEQSPTYHSSPPPCQPTTQIQTNVPISQYRGLLSPVVSEVPRRALKFGKRNPSPFSSCPPRLTASPHPVPGRSQRLLQATCE